ncbi:hypothetical protein GCM10022275_29470 [Tessaracoccus defluvii]|nr:hypothetical protein [Tessaracoccus defluvii]
MLRGWPPAGSVARLGGGDALWDDEPSPFPEAQRGGADPERVGELGDGHGVLLDHLIVVVCFGADHAKRALRGQGVVTFSGERDVQGADQRCGLVERERAYLSQGPPGRDRAGGDGELAVGT